MTSDDRLDLRRTLADAVRLGDKLYTRVRIPVIPAFEDIGFLRGDSGGGCEWLHREVGSLQGHFIAITDDGGVDAPEYWHDPCVVGFYNAEGDQVGTWRGTAAEVYATLADLLEGFTRNR